MAAICAVVKPASAVGASQGSSLSILAEPHDKTVAHSTTSRANGVKLRLAVRVAREEIITDGSTFVV
jgi:hypothetical protein